MVVKRASMRFPNSIQLSENLINLTGFIFRSSIISNSIFWRTIF